MPAPSAPTGFTASPTPYGILLKWDAQAGLDGFFVFRGLQANHGDAALYPTDSGYAAAGDGTAFMDVAAAPGTHYYYQLVASSVADGESTRVNADAVAVAAGMSLTDARAWVKQFARNADNPDSYTVADVDRALFTVGQRFCRKTKCVRAAGNVALTAASGSADVSGLTLFLPERLLSGTIVDAPEPLELVGWEALYRKRVDCPSQGTPTELAFETEVTAGVWRTPKVDATLRLYWWQPFTSWTLGTGSPNAVTFNLPDAYLGEILTYGVTALLQHNEPQNQYASESWQKYLAFEQEMMGAGNLAVREINRRR